MRKFLVLTLGLILAFGITFVGCSRDKKSDEAKAPEAKFPYLVGRGMTDITGPAKGLQMFGFVRGDQITEGVHFRLRSRAFIVADPAEGGGRVALVSTDTGSITYEITRTVIEKLKAKYGDIYNDTNIVISATHTHCGPGGYWHYGSDTPIGGGFYQQHFDAIVDGIVGSISAAHETLKPGRILINKGIVENAGANRSAVAYDNNPAEERARYDINMDRDMTLIRFEDATGAIGVFNWFAVHPTSMTFHNKLISGDHKGYASMRFEKMKLATYADPNDFVAAFANANCGDITPNLNLNNTGPTDDQFENTKIIGSHQLDKALELFHTAEEELSGPIETRHSFVDFSQVAVSDEFTRAGPQSTCASAMGYSFGAGSGEDGGGHPMLKEGMLERSGMIDGMISGIGGLKPPSDALRNCQAPKPILFASGEMDPPAHSQIHPITLVRVGQLVLLCSPCEVTTMAGRRMREKVQAIMGDKAKYAVIAAYSNSFHGYVTTKEEYDTQQYEGGHTIYGPWTNAAYVQEFARLATALKDGKPVEPGPTPKDVRPGVKSIALGFPYDVAPADKKFGSVEKEPADSVKRGTQVEVIFWTGHPQNDFRVNNNFLEVQIQSNGKWVKVADDSDWETKIRFHQPDGPPPPDPYALKPAAPAGEFVPLTMTATITWEIPKNAKPGTYRILHNGAYKMPEGAIHRFEAKTKNFAVVE